MKWIFFAESGALDIDPETLDDALRFLDPELAPLDFSPCNSPSFGDDISSDGHSKKKSKRRSKEQRHHKHHRKSKDLNTSFLSDDPIDRLVAANVDEILLDCLEDELPSVMINNELPGIIMMVFHLLDFTSLNMTLHENFRL